MAGFHHCWVISLLKPHPSGGIEETLVFLFPVHDYRLLQPSYTFSFTYRLCRLSNVFQEKCEVMALVGTCYFGVSVILGQVLCLLKEWIGEESNAHNFSPIFQIRLLAKPFWAFVISWGQEDFCVRWLLLLTVVKLQCCRLGCSPGGNLFMKWTSCWLGRVCGPRRGRPFFVKPTYQPV